MANRYWVGGTASWDATAGTKWSTTSGGGGGAAVPTSSDDVFFDAASGAVTVTTSVFPVALNLNFTGFTGTFAGNGNITVSGSLTLGSGMTYTHSSSSMVFDSSSSVTITSNGITMTCPINFNGTGTWTLQDNFATSSTFQLTTGTLTLNNFNISSSSFVSPGSGTRVLNMGSGTWNILGVGTSWNISGATNLTVNAGTSTIKWATVSVTSRTFAGAGFTYYRLWISGTSTWTIFNVQGSNTFNEIKDDATQAHSLRFTAGTTTTVANFNVNGSSGNLITVDSASASTSTHALVKTGTGFVNCDYLAIAHSVATPSSTWYAGINSTDNQATATSGSGWIFTAPPTTNSGFLAFM